MLLCVLMGFSSGLPLYVLIQLIPAWLRSEGIGLAAIGLFKWVELPYSWKFVWAPLADRYVPPFLGRRRGWALITQVGLLFALVSFGAFDASRHMGAIAALALIVALFSATQDIALDAYRRELLPDEELGLGTSLFINVYRAAGAIPGGLALVIADRAPWSVVHATVAAFMVIGILATLLAPEMERPSGSPTSLRQAVLGPFREFFGRADLRSALLILAFMFFYKLGDTMATALITPFYLDVGFSMTEVGTVVKLISLSSTVVGGVTGGVIITRIGINRSLWVFGLVQLSSIVGFVVLSEAGAHLSLLAAVVAFEYLGVGLGTSAFVAFIARATDKRFTATQYALFSSFTALPRIATGASAGFIIEALGYTQFFVLCTLLAIPGMLLLFKVAPWNPDPAASNAHP